jgi:hypothetical protein
MVDRVPIWYRQVAYLVQFCLSCIVDLVIFLGQQQDFLVVGHRRLESENGFFAADKQRNDHMRVNHHIP